MSWNSSRRAIFVLLVLTVAISAVWLEQGRGQDKVQVKQQEKAIQPIGPGGPPAAKDAGVNPDGFSNGGGVTLPKDDKGRGRTIEAAVDYINDEKWDIAIERLQKLLDIDEDVYVRLKRKNAEGKEVFVWVSAKHEANRLIGTLPPAGLDFYKTTHGATAAAMLKKGKQNGDPALLAEIMKRFAHTDAGGEAIQLLAAYHLDRGNYPSALYCYSKLFSRPGADKLPVEVIAKAWSAARMSPTSDAAASTALSGNVLSAKELWKQLRERTRELKFGEQTITLDEFEEYVTKLERPNFNLNATDAIVFRATPNRGNQLVGGPAFMSATWRRRMYQQDKSADLSEFTGAYEPISDEESHSPAKEYIAKAALKMKGLNQPIISAFSPITVTVTQGEKKVPLLIYKNYWGLVARNLKTGMTAWASPSNWSLQGMLKSNSAQGTQAITPWLQYYVEPHYQYPQILFENSTTNTLSTDGQFVYVVDDLAVPPPQPANINMGFNPGMNGGAVGKDVQDAIAHSRLQVFDLKTNGKLVYETDSSDEKSPLAGCYFLGPPLPLGGKLYVLTEKQQELRLVCFEMVEVPGPERRPMHVVKVVSTQTLGTTTEKMENGVIRRTTAAHLAYGEGILVCPTNSGAVFGINLLENSLVWAYPYREKTDQPQQQVDQWGRPINRGGGMAWIQGPNNQFMMPLTGHENHWKGSAPVVSEGKVVFTAPDARSLHCINLRDGSLVWRKPKLPDDLYLGNVYNGKVLIVGKKNVRGLSLATGETLWTLDTGVPSGQGIGSDNVYYLPLKETVQGKDDPQIVGIDMDRGKFSSSSKSRPRTPGGKDLDVPGNLLFYEGDVISVTPEEVVAYQQLKVKIAQMDELIAKNPNDPIGLTQRGDLRLDKGDLAGAIEDLSTALKNKPDPQTRAQARSKLYDTLTVYISEHFKDAEKYLQEYKELCQVDMEGATETERPLREAEQRRRRATYLWLVGKGREEQGRLVEAFEKYQQFGAEAGKQQELVPAVDESNVKAAPDVWSRGRIIAMMAKAKPEHREPLEKLIAGKWDKLRETNDLNELRQFVRLFGSVSASGKEARLQLVERLMDQKDSKDDHPLLEAELELNQFRTGQHSPELAGRATEALARLYTRKSLLEDAAYCYRKLGTEYAKVLIRDGKTGRDLYNDTATDKRLLPYLDETDPLGSVKLKAKKESDGYQKQMPAHGRLFQFEHSGEKLPFFRQHIVGLTLDPNHEFKLLDRTQEDENKAPKEIWSQKLSPTMFQLLTNQVLGQANMNPNFINNNQNHYARFPYRTVGHLIVLPVGHLVYGIDPVNHRVLWQKNLAVGGSEPYKVKVSQPNGPMWDQQQHPPLVDSRDGSVLLTYSGGWAQRLGQVGPLEGQTICVQTRDNSLSALDPLSGRTLWSRADVNSRNYLFADEDHIFVVELDDGNNPHASRVFRAADGISVKAPDFATLFGKRLQVFGRHILVSEVGPSNTVNVRLYDPLTGQDEWKQSYPSRSIVARSEDPHFTAVIDPEGKVHVIDLRARKEVMTGQMAVNGGENHLRNVQGVHLLSDRKNFYLACQAPMQVNNGNPFGGVPVSNVMTNLGMRTVPVNGRLYAFERATGEVSWHAEAKNQMLVLDQFRELPVVLLTSRHMTMPPGRGQQWTASVLSIEKWSGRVLFPDTDNLQNATNFFGVRVDARASTIDFLSPNVKITHYPGPQKVDKAVKPDAQTSAPQAPEAKPRTPIGGRIKRSTIDRVRIREIADPLPAR